MRDEIKISEKNTLETLNWWIPCQETHLAMAISNQALKLRQVVKKQLQSNLRLVN